MTPQNPERHYLIKNMNKFQFTFAADLPIIIIG